ncbi:MAG: cupin domain-containing protein [Acidimicrobiales bacterium]
MSEPADRYFAAAEGQPQGPGRYVNVDADVAPVELVAGLIFRPVVGADVMATFVRFEPHTEAPTHAHAEEQFTIVLDGELEFVLDGETRVLRAGDVAVVPPFVPHGARTRDSHSDEIDVFCPPRQALLQHLRDQPAE